MKRQPRAASDSFHEGVEPLPLTELLEWTAVVAEEVRRGRHDIHADPDERWHVRLLRDERVDVWLISWTTDQGTQLHDHGGSLGAYTVVSGELSEARWDPVTAQLTEQVVAAGDAVAFGASYVHDVRNIRSTTAVSVHAYSPPLTHMNFYDVLDGELTPLAKIWTDDPEVAIPDLRAAS
jgi:mannose-6-phosphate isomerase-like protein (cupin superfamily)